MLSETRGEVNGAVERPGSKPPPFLSIAYLTREGYTHAYIDISYSIVMALSNYLYLDGIVQSSLPLHPLFRHPWMGRLWLRLAYGAVKLFFRLCCQVHIEGK